MEHGLLEEAARARGGATRVEEVRAQGGWAARGQEPVPAEIAFAPIAVLQSPIR